MILEVFSSLNDSMILWISSISKAAIPKAHQYSFESFKYPLLRSVLPVSCHVMLSKFVDTTSLGGNVSTLEGSLVIQRDLMRLENQADRSL
ncbi:hypothetical protein QYF61_022798 [Mycteria americana]|uniref:Uncharacterized protein n=1 Tax=Mycteria americana TaxID=33587 RepID=A0AAN7PTC9_MYCAM|nr:hypothetical protein QYF61_022798 [Mycteria americana]